MPYPSPPQYRNAILNSHQTLSEARQEWKPCMNPLFPNEPVYMSGNFATVFKLQRGSEYVAIKCFTRELPTRAARFQAIASHLKQLDCPYFVKFDFLEKEIWVDGEEYDVLWMEWAEGETLGSYVRKKAEANDTDALEALYKRFADFALFMHLQPFAHGDLKPDNILVMPNGHLRLLDYDGLFVPTIANLGASEAGTPPYQHPKRRGFDASLDDFSLLALCIELRTLAKKPELLRTHGNSESLLLSPQLLANLDTHPLTGQLLQLFDNGLTQMLGLFRTCLQRPSHAVSELPELLLPELNDLQTLRKAHLELWQQHQRLTWKSGSKNGDIKTFTVKGVSFNMIYVEAGTFMMGRDNESFYGHERPVHPVTISKGYWMGETPVTQALYEAVMGKNPSRFEDQPQNPVEEVSWNDTRIFLQKLHAILGNKGFRLPSEAEWEFAARGGIKSKGYKYAGSNDIDEVAWYEESSDETTQPVKQKKPNEIGIYDMSGNVWEWCEDDWHGSYNNAPDDGNAWIDSPRHQERVLRGGSYAWHYRAALRYDCTHAGGERFLTVGFRIAMAGD